MATDQIIKKIRACTSLPTLPAVAVKVLEEVRSDDVEIQELAWLIGQDPALTSKVLRTANSAFYGLTKTVSTISHALIVLGTESVKTLVLGFSLVRSLNDGGLGGQTQMAYWRRSSYTAAAARLLCQRLDWAHREELFLAGLLQDIGIQVLKKVAANPYDQLLADTPRWGRQLARRETARFGLSHCEAGLILAEQWHLPPLLAEAIRWHHQPRQAGEDFVESCRLINLAGLCAEVFVGNADGRCIQRVRRYAWTAFNLDAQACDGLLTAVGLGAQELTELFDIDIGGLKPYEDILAEANETLQDLSLQSELRARKMQVQAETDPLTGLANRRKLDDQLAQEFRRACQFHRPLSVVFLDADRFKSINDQHGHATGDLALIHLARVLESAARPMDTAGRYGGEEFVLILPEMPLAGAAALAEQVRARVQASPLSLPAGPLNMTVSVGVAGFDGAPGAYRQGSLLIQAADRACYAAKTAGRNTVRVFSPRVASPTTKP